MHQSKTARLLGIFDKKEYPLIERFLETTSKGSAEVMRPLFRHLCHYQTRKPKDALDTAFLQEALGWLPQDHGTPAKLNFALHQLKQLLEDYLLLDYHRREELAREKALLAALRERQASEFVLEASARIDKLTEVISKGPTYYDAEAALINVQFNHPYPNQFARRKYDILDVIRSHRRIHLSLALVHHWNMMLEGIQFSGLDEGKQQSIRRLLQDVDADPEFAAEPFIRAYALAVRSTLDRELQFSTFQAIRDAANSILGQASAQEIMGLMNLQINYLLLLQSVSLTPYREDLLALYRLGLENGGLFKDGYLSYADFTNMMMTSAQARHFAWAKEMMAQHGNRLNPAIREPMLALARARITYFEGDPAEALRLLQPGRQQLNDPDKLYEKFLRSYCYYELGHLDLLEAHLEAFRKFILRHKNFTDGLRRAPEDFIRILRKLLAATDARHLHELQEELQTKPAIYCYEWLSKQVGERLDRLS